MALSLLVLLSCRSIFAPQGHVFACVKDATTGAGIAAVAITFFRDAYATVMTDGTGCTRGGYRADPNYGGEKQSVYLTISLPVGYVVESVTGASPGLPPPQTNVTVEISTDDPDVTVTWFLYPPGSIEATVTSATAVPGPSRVTIRNTVTSESMAQTAVGFVGTSSVARFDGVSVGPYEVLVEPPPQWEPVGPPVLVTVVSKQLSQVTLPIRPASGTSILQGRTARADGTAVPGVLIRAVHEATAATRTFITDANGQYGAAGLEPGPYTLTVETIPENYGLDVGEAAVKTVTLDPGATTTVDWRLALAYGTIAGRVTAGAFGVGGAQIAYAAATGAESGAVLSSPNGDYQINPILTGTQRLTLTPPADFALAPGETSQKTAVVQRFQTTQVNWSLVPIAIVFRDDFTVGNQWTVDILLVPAGGPWTHAVQNESTGGASGGYRKMTYTQTAATAPQEVAIHARNIFTGGSYDPRTQGPIQSIDYREDNLVDPDADVSTAFLVVQGGVFYSTAPVEIGINPGWRTTTLSGLTPNQFLPAPGPDFSANGTTMQFGYVRIASGGGQIAHIHGIDNWRVTIHR